MKYPDFVKENRPKGTVVKKVGDAYYVYYATSARVPGKSYPVQQIKGYAGTIDCFGFHPSDKVTIHKTDVVIRECGFTNYLLKFEELYYVQNKSTKNRSSRSASNTLYRNLIMYLSNNSYLADTEKIILTPEEMIERFGIGIPNQITAIQKMIEIDLDELEPLKQICSVRMGGEMFESKLTAVQEELLKRLGLEENDIRT